MDINTFIKVSFLMIEAASLAVAVMYTISRFPFRHQAMLPTGGMNYYKVCNVRRGDVWKSARPLVRKGWKPIIVEEHSRGTYSIALERAWAL